MSVENVRAYLDQWGKGDAVREFTASSATVTEAALAVGVNAARIAKTLTFKDAGDSAIIIVAAGDARIDNKKFKGEFGLKAKMLDHDVALELTGHAVGGICPFALKNDLPVYLDVSLKRFATVFPAAGSDHSAVEMTCEELTTCSQARKWVDVCKDWDENLTE